MKILSVDDSKAVHAFITSLFQGLPHELQHAYNGSDGVSKAVSGDFDPDIVLMDWEMPEKNGIEALKEIRKRGSNVPVIMITSKNTPDEIASALEMGANEFVMKPFTQDILFDKIEAVTGKSVKD